MKDYFLEIIYVIAMSKRTQFAFVMGILFFVGINLLGEYMATKIEFNGLLKSLEHKLLRRYDRVALGALIAFWLLALKFYNKDKHKYW